MRKIISLSAALVAVCLVQTNAQVQPKHQLKFNANGKFKMVQFTDIHFGEDYDEDVAS